MKFDYICILYVDIIQQWSHMAEVEAFDYSRSWQWKENEISFNSQESSQRNLPLYMITCTRLVKHRQN